MEMAVEPVAAVNLGVIGSRTFPVTREQFEKLTPTAKRETLERGRRIVTERMLRELNAVDYQWVVSGKCPDSPDTWGIEAARTLKKYKNRIQEFPAQWNLLGKRAGFVRNMTIAEWSHRLLAFWDGESNGTRDTIGKAHDLGHEVIVIFGDGRERSNRKRSDNAGDVAVREPLRRAA